MPPAKDVRFCRLGGHLVRADLPVPDDPTEYEDARDNTTIGCNHIECAWCDVPVRQARDLRIASKEDVSPAALYDAADWRAAPGVEALRGARLYACRCSTWLELTWHCLTSEYPDPLSDPELPWRCAGHPAPTLPLDVDGVRVDATTDIPALVDRVLREGGPPGAHVRVRPVPCFWLWRLHVRLERTPRDGEVSRAVGARVADADEGARGSALFFFSRVARAPGFERVIALAEADPAGVGTRRYVIPGHGLPGASPLSLITRRLRERPPGEPPDALDQRAAALFKDLVTRPGLPWPEPRAERGEDTKPNDVSSRRIEALRAIACVDPGWLAENAPAIERAGAGRWEAVIWALEWVDRLDLIPVTAAILLERGTISGGALATFIEEEVGGRPWGPALRAFLDHTAGGS